MKRLLKQKTATTVMIGEFIDDSDGKTARGDLTISASEIFLSKNGSAYSAKNDSASAVPDPLFTGWYKCSLNATDTSASGTLTLAVHTTGALPVWKSWEIFPSNVYDSTLGNDLLDTNIDDVLNTTVEGLYNVQDILQGSSAALVGKLTGGSTTRLTFRDLEDTKNRVTLDVDTSGNRFFNSLTKDEEWRFAVQIQSSQYDTKTEADEVLGWSGSRVTDMLLFAIDISSTKPYEWLGQSDVNRVTTLLYDGVTPIEYMISNASASGINVWAWIWIMYAPYWCGGTDGSGIILDMPYDDTHQVGTVYNMLNETARDDLVEGIAEFVESNPGLYGIMLGWEAVLAGLTETETNDFFVNLRAAIDAIDPDIKIITGVGGYLSADENYDFDTDYLLSSGTWDGLKLGYYQNMEVYRQYIETIGGEGKLIFYGISSEVAQSRPSDFKFRILQQESYNHHTFDFFDFGSTKDTEYTNIIDSYKAGTLSVEQPPITSVSVDPGTSFTLVVDGVEQTTLYTDVSTHVYSGPLKEHVEAAIGSENPAVMYRRWNSTSTVIVVGDYDP